MSGIRTETPRIRTEKPFKTARRHFDPNFLDAVSGYDELLKEFEDAVHKAGKAGDYETLGLAMAYLVKVIQACELWDAFQKADRFRIEDRANVHAPGKVAGQNSVVKILGISRNGVYARMDSVDLRPQDFAGVRSAVELVTRSPKLRDMREQLQKYRLKPLKPR